MKLKSRELAVAEEIAGAPAKFQKIVADAFARTASPRRAIQAQCLTCTHYNRAEIRACMVYRCPLWQYRPYQTKEKAQ